MEPIAWHIVLRTQDGRLLVPTARERRLFSSVVGRYAEEYRIPAFDSVRDHGHVIAACSREEAGHLTRDLKNALQRWLDLPSPFLRIDPSPIADRVHLIKSIHYVLGQAARHEVFDDPLREASVLPDLLGYRISQPGAIERLRVLAPSLRFEELVRHLGSLRLLPGSDPRHLLDSADSAAGACSLRPRSSCFLETRRAAVQVGYELNATTDQIAEYLGLSPTRTRALRSARRSADVAAVRAIQLQIGLREQARIQPTRQSARGSLHPG